MGAAVSNSKIAGESSQREMFMSMFDSLAEKFLPKDGEYDISKHLPGPLKDRQRYPHWVDGFIAFNKAQGKGHNHIQIASWQKAYGGEQGLSANIVIPKILFYRSDGDVGPPTQALINEVVISNPKDAERIARLHVRKEPNFTPIMYGSIISTIDNSKWKEQRAGLVHAFLPKASLGQIFPVSSARARECAAKLWQVSAKGTQTVDMNDFLLFETQAQLQLALFGEDDAFMQETNKKFRDSMQGLYDAKYVRPFCRELSERMKRKTNTPPLVPGENGESVRGPLSHALSSLDVDQKTVEGNALIFAFAGHDTTGHTMTWLLYELAKNKSLQQRAQEEVDAFFAELGGGEPTYEDLKKLPFMTRCMMETLRLWPAVANGTFRQIQFDDVITGPNGEDVKIKKGTFVNINNWSRHRNPDLWGDDVNTFNPDRSFEESEIWHNTHYAAYNPSTHRFSPFTFPPRDCIGKNFAHMESRVILANLLRNFSFELNEETKAFLDTHDPENALLGINYGTMGPRDLLQPETIKVERGWTIPVRTPTGLHMRVVPRRTSDFVSSNL